MGRPKLAYNVGTCSEVDCDRPIHCRGVCARHYRRLHYVERERERRGAQPKPKLPIGTTRTNAGGYVIVKIGPGRAWKLQHRLVMEGVLGRPLDVDETVHHINGDKTDNRPENLELWSSRHPGGQRSVDLVEFAHQILERYEGHVRAVRDRNR